MKKFFLFVSTVFLSLFLVNNKIYAQEYPGLLMKAPFLEFYYEQTNSSTYEYIVEYGFEYIYIEELDNKEYLFVHDYPSLTKGLNRFANSYVLEDIEARTWGDDICEVYCWTRFTLRITVDKSIIDTYGNYNSDDVLQYFLNDSAFYVRYYSSDPSDPSGDYSRGYNDGYGKGFDDGFNVGRDVGYNNGYNVGYDEGYNEGHQDGRSEGYNIGYDFGYNEGYNVGYGDGVRATEPQAYQRGYNDGYEEATNTAVSKFTSNLHVWLVPAIIIVVIAGIFVGYRRERYGND